MNDKDANTAADTFMWIGFVCLFIQIAAIAMKYVLVPQMGVNNYRLLLLGWGIVTASQFIVSVLFRPMHRKYKPKVIGWTLYDKNQVSWESVHKDDDPSAWSDVEQAIVDEIRRKKYKFGGNYHQYGKSGCPIMEDGTTVMVSMRHWGDIMSRVWGGNYCDYAWTHDQGEDYKVPKAKDGSWNKVRWMTEADIAERDRQMEEARKQADAEREKMMNERAKEQAKQHKQDMTWAIKFADKFFKKRGLKVNVDVCNAVAELLVKGYEDVKDPCCKSLKWIFEPSERKRVEAERKKNLKKAFEQFNKLLDEHDADEDKTEEEK